MSDNLIVLEGLKKSFAGQTGLRSAKRTVWALDGVDLEIKEGETVGLVGESGSGKTTLARIILRLATPDSGTVRFMGEDVFGLGPKELKGFHREAQLIFQNPMSALNPRKTVGQILSEPYLLHDRVRGSELHDEVSKLLETVELAPSLYMNRLPHELSGGQRQRVVIARAIALRPKFIVADEPVSSLDVSVRGQILNLMKKLQREFGLTYLFITHDLSVVRSFCTRVAVMYCGRLVEVAEVDELFRNPRHPYTELLLASTTNPDPESRGQRERAFDKLFFQREASESDAPSQFACKFYPRCRLGLDVCRTVDPRLVDVGGGHLVACHVRAPAVFAGQM